MANQQIATCRTAEWTFNSRGQSPCVVGSALAGACVGGDFTLTGLEPDFVYLGPSVSAATPCRCSSVYYSMLSACATCQGNNFIRWQRYATNCSTVYQSVFPRDIPQSISVPAWAYVDVTTSDTWNATLAQSLAGTASDSTAPSQPTGGSTTGSTTSSGSSPGSTSGGSGSDPQKKSSNTGAIAGGVVGGIVGLALIAGLIFFLLRRRNRQKHLPPSALYGPQGVVSEKPAPMSHYTGDGSTYSNGPVYDPNNPATYPTSDASLPYAPPPGQPANFNAAPPSPGYAYGAQQANGGYMPVHMTGQSANSGFTQANPSVTQPSGPRYTGAPEL